MPALLPLFSFTNLSPTVVGNVPHLLTDLTLLSCIWVAAAFSLLVRLSHLPFFPSPLFPFPFCSSPLRFFPPLGSFLHLLPSFGFFYRALVERITFAFPFVSSFVSFFSLCLHSSDLLPQCPGALVLLLLVSFASCAQTCFPWSVPLARYCSRR